MSDDNKPDNNKPMGAFVGGRGNKSTFPKIDLKDLESSKKTFAKVIKQYAEGNISENQARALCYLMSNYLAYLREEKNIDLENRVEALEARND